MFRKLIANLSYSPSLIGELGAYAKRLKYEERVRFIGIVFLALTITVQIITTLSPPESANKASNNDIVYGGIVSKSDLLNKYDRNEQNLQDIYTSLGISRTDILTSTSTTSNSKEFTYIAGRTSLFGSKNGERALTYKKVEGGTGTLYAASAQSYDTTALASGYGTNYRVLSGTSPSAGHFAILENSGNIMISKLVNRGPEQPCPSNYALDISSPSCQDPVAQSQTAFNNTQRTDTRSSVAAPSDRISYVTQFSNMSERSITPQLSTHLGDILEYADIVDTEGGTFDAAGNTITWNNTPIDPHGATTRTFTVRVKPHIPATAQGASNPTSFDCMLMSPVEDPRADTTKPVKVQCPLVKSVETLASELPHTNPLQSLVGSGIILILSVYLYSRARLQREELRLIRKDINTGDTLA